MLLEFGWSGQGSLLVALDMSAAASPLILLGALRMIAVMQLMQYRWRRLEEATPIVRLC